MIILQAGTDMILKNGGIMIFIKEEKMKKHILILTASVFALALSACGGGEKPAEPAQTEAEAWVEELPAKNELDPANPIPADTGTLELHEQVFEAENLKLMLPDGVSAVEEAQAKELGGIGRVTVTDDAGEWKLMFRTHNFALGNVVNNVSNTTIYDGNSVKTDWSKDVPATLAGFPARVWANNTRKGWLHPSNENDAPGVDIVVDYGETLVGQWLGLQIRLEAANPTEDTNIYEILYRRDVRAVLNNFSVIETPGGEGTTVNGITATFPARWPVKTGENSMVALLHSEELKGGINMSTQYNPDPQHHADSFEGGEQFTRTYGDNDWIGVIVPHVFEKEGEEPVTRYSMDLFSEFSDKMCANVHVDLTGGQPEDYKAFLDNSQFVDLMNSVKLDPAGWHQPGTAEVNGILSDGGSIRSYSGTDAEVEIPAFIGDYNTVYIGGSAFKNNTSVKKVVIPEGVTEIQDNAFLGCSNLETVVLPETLTYIYQNAFRDCPKLADVVLPDSVSYVGTAAFSGSGTGTFQGSGAEYDSHCFDESGFDKISFAAGADISAAYMFDGAMLSEIALPEDLSAIGEGAFVNCHNIQKIELPDTVRSIGEGAFSSMFGLPYINLPEGITEIPEGCFNSTTLDVLVIPESVTKIGAHATYAAACIIIQNPEAEIGEGAIKADYVFLQDAKRHVFPSDHEEMEGSCLYLDGVYDPETEIQGDIYNATAFSYQIYLPSDATFEESDALDSYLVSRGYDDIAWIGAAKDFLPEDTFGFETKNNMILGYHGDSKKLAIPFYNLFREDDWWITANVYSIADEAFKDSDFTSAYFRGNCGDSIGSRILAGNTALTDIWFNYNIIDEVDGTNSTSGLRYYQPDTFAGIPENVTVHLPASIAEGERAALEEKLHGIGIPAGASFDYYSLR